MKIPSIPTANRADVFPFHDVPMEQMLAWSAGSDTKDWMPPVHMVRINMIQASLPLGHRATEEVEAESMRQGTYNPDMPPLLGYIVAAETVLERHRDFYFDPALESPRPRMYSILGATTLTGLATETAAHRGKVIPTIKNPDTTTEEYPLPDFETAYLELEAEVHPKMSQLLFQIGEKFSPNDHAATEEMFRGAFIGYRSLLIRFRQQEVEQLKEQFKL